MLISEIHAERSTGMSDSAQIERIRESIKRDIDISLKETESHEKRKKDAIAALAELQESINKNNEKLHKIMDLIDVNNQKLATYSDEANKSEMKAKAEMDKFHELSSKNKELVSFNSELINTINDSTVKKDYLTKEMERLTHAISDLSSVRNKTEEQIKASQMEISNLKKHIDDLSKTRDQYNELKKEMEDLNSKKSHMLNELAGLKSQIDIFESNKTKLMEMTNRLSQENQSMEVINSNLKSAVANYNQTMTMMTDLENKRKHLSDEINALIKERTFCENEVEELEQMRRDKVTFEIQYSDLKNRVASMNAELEATKKTNAELLSMNNSLVSKSNQLTKDIEDKTKMIEKFNIDYTNRKNQLESMKNALMDDVVTYGNRIKNEELKKFIKVEWNE